MKVIILATLTVLNLLSNLLHIWKLFAIFEDCFVTIIRNCHLPTFLKITMDQQEEQEQEQPARERIDADGRQAQEIMDMDVEEEEEDVSVSDDSEDVDDDSDDVDDVDNVDDREDDDDDDDDDDDSEMVDNDIEELDDNISDDVWDCHSSNDLIHIPLRMRRYYREQSRPLYAFQPLRLIKLNYKLRSQRQGYPSARSGHRVIASESCLYLLGGYHPIRTNFYRQSLLFQELWSYNFATNRWKLMLSEEHTENMPSDLASNAMVIYHNVLISHGGTGFPFGESCSNDCYVFTTTSNKPTVRRLEVTGDLPTAQYGPGIVIHEDYLYTIGGTTGFEYSCDVYRLNLKTRVWENVYICRPEMRNDPEGRYRHEVVYDGAHIFVLGGGTSNSVYDLQRIPAFNLKTNCWDYFDTLPDRTVATTTSEAPNAGFPQPRKCLSCVQHTASNGEIEAFITGGLQGHSETYFADIWKLNLHSKQWTCIRTASLPKPLYFHSAAHSDNGCMYIFGGIEYNKKDMRRRNDLYKMWMTIPKLSEMCWDAITFYNEDLNCFSRATLLKEGIPESFIKRLAPPQKIHKRYPTSEPKRPRWESV